MLLKKAERLKEGRAEGIKEGIKEGKEKTVREHIINMLKENLDINLIIKITNKSEKEILEIKKSLNK